MITTYKQYIEQQNSRTSDSRVITNWTDIIGWRHLPEPPAPTDFGQWPLAPKPYRQAKRRRSDTSWRKFRIDGVEGKFIEGELKLTSVTIDAEGSYEMKYRGTATKDSSISQTTTITTGVSTTNSVGVGMSITAGVEAEAGIVFASAKASLSATVSASFNHSWSYSEQISKSTTFTLAPQTHPRISGVWWQVYENFHVEIEGYRLRHVTESSLSGGGGGWQGGSSVELVGSEKDLSDLPADLINRLSHYGLQKEFGFLSQEPSIILTQFPSAAG